MVSGSHRSASHTTPVAESDGMRGAMANASCSRSMSFSSILNLGTEATSSLWAQPEESCFRRGLGICLSGQGFQATTWYCLGITRSSLAGAKPPSLRSWLCAPASGINRVRGLCSHCRPREGQWLETTKSGLGCFLVRCRHPVGRIRDGFVDLSDSHWPRLCFCLGGFSDLSVPPRFCCLERR